MWERATFPVAEDTRVLGRGEVTEHGSVVGLEAEGSAGWRESHSSSLDVVF